MNAFEVIECHGIGGRRSGPSLGIRGLALSLLLSCIYPTVAFSAEAAVGKLEETASSESVSLPLALGALEQVVGFQFDVVVAEGQATAGSPALMTASDHIANSTSPEAGRRRLAVHSPTNAQLPATLDLRVPISLLSAAPSGGPSISLENLIFTDAEGNALPVSVNYSGIEQWRRDHFTEEERLDPDIIGDDRDPDGDGSSNIAEFFRGTSPQLADAGPLLQVVKSLPEDPTALFKVLFWKSKTGVDGEASAWAEASFDLKAWSSSEVHVQATGVETGSALELEASLDRPVGETPSAGFIRITFQRD